MRIANPLQVPSGIYLYTLHPTRLAMLTDGATPEEKMTAAHHWAYSQDLLKRGIIVFAGRTLTRDAASFASCVIRAESEAAARKIMGDDPAVAGGVFSAKLYPFQPMLMGEWPSEAATV